MDLSLFVKTGPGTFKWVKLFAIGLSVSNNWSIPEDKYVRMHLKGRPIALYAPTNIEDDGKYDVKAAQNPPAQELKLEWVYPFVDNIFYTPTANKVFVVYMYMRITLSVSILNL